MPSILPGFEYDIFISYRQKDNKGDHWVTEFVNALKAELDATFKEEISIYFNAKKDIHLLSETYDRELKDVLALQSEMAIEIAQALESRLTTAEKEEINKEVRTEVSAYDYYLQTRDKVSKAAFTKEDFRRPDLINKAIKKAPLMRPFII